MNNFLSFIAMDWSGSALPIRTPSVSIAWIEPLSSIVQRVRPPDGRLWSRAHSAQWLIQHVRNGAPRTFVGIDANLGLPAGLVKQAVPGVDTDGIRALWREVDRFCESDPNYYGGAMAHHPAFAPLLWIQGAQPASFPPARRVTEQCCGDTQVGLPETPFKWIGPRQVGKGGFAAMRLAADLDRGLGEQVAFWPFDPPARLNRARLVMTEIYPRLFLCAHTGSPRKIRGRSALISCLAASQCELDPADTHDLSDHDTDALVAAASMRHLCGQGAQVPRLLHAPLAMTRNAKTLEGWIFGL